MIGTSGCRLGFGCIITSKIEAPNNYVSESGIKWMSGSTKRQCDRALAPPRDRGELLLVVGLAQVDVKAILRVSHAAWYCGICIVSWRIANKIYRAASE